MRAYGVIPARLQSTRLPRKLLLAETGRPLLQYTWEAACRARSLAEVIVATDSMEIADVVRRFGGRCEMTGEHPSGTDRIAEVARRCCPDADVVVNIQGNNTGILIGRKGKTLEALEFIVNKAVNRTSEKKVRVIVDSENYRKRREEALQTLALNMGEKAKKTKRTVTTDPISPRDRRIVHLALKGDSQVSTKSEGEGLFKRVSIIPNKSKVD